MMRIIKYLSITVLFFGHLVMNAQDPDCSSYLAHTVNSQACADQPLLLQIPMDECPGTVSFCFDITSDFFTSELFVDVLDGSSAVVASPITAGDFANGTQSGNICVGPFDAANGPYTLFVGDDFGDGNDGTIVITDTNNGNSILYNTTLPGATNPAGTFDLSPLVIDPNTTITVNWYENGVITQTDASIDCGDLFKNYILTSSSICQTEDQTIGYEIICDVDGFVLATNTAIPITVFPPVAPDVADLVMISYEDDPSGGCASPTIIYLNDCTAAEVMVTENTAPADCGVDASVTGNVSFEIVYLGPTGGPDCCATGGPAVPVNESGDNTDVVMELGPQSQFGGTNNAEGFSYTTATPGCGAAMSGSTLTFNVCDIMHLPGNNFTDGDLPPTGQDPVDVNGVMDNENYFVTIYVDGAVVFDGDLTTGGGFDDWTLCADNILDLSTFGFTGGSTVQVFVYPNQLGTVQNGVDWEADISVSVDISYEVCLESSPVDCSFDVDIAYDCACPTTTNYSTSISDPCDCNDDQSANGAGDGTFSETIQVEVTDGNGDPVTNMNLCVANGSTSIAAGTSIPHVGGGIYEITFNHTDNVGYSISIAECSDLDVVVDGPITNVCHYPIAEFSLPASVCDDASPVDLSALASEISGDGDFGGSFAFTGTGVTGTMFDPVAAGQGSFMITATYTPTNVVGTTPGTDANCPTEIIMTINVTDCTVCNADNGTLGISIAPAGGGRVGGKPTPKHNEGNTPIDKNNKTNNKKINKEK